MYSFYSRGNTNVGKVWFVIGVFFLALLIMGNHARVTIKEIEANTARTAETLLQK